MTVRAWAYVGPYVTHSVAPVVTGPPVHVSQAVVEVLIQPVAATKVSQVVIEVMLHT